MKLSVSILNIDYKNIEKNLNDIIDDIDYVHLDVMDGVFVKNLSFGPALIKSIRPLTEKTFDTHLMIINPEKYIKDYVDAGSNIITFHVEATGDVLGTINLIKSYNVKAGLSIKPNTEVNAIKEFLPYLDMVLIMSVEPGFGGQKFMENSIAKAKELQELKKKNNYHYEVNIDGGINNETIKKVKDYLDVCVVGSYIVSDKNPKEKIELIRNA
mgnify:CR=1 FL=1